MIIILKNGQSPEQINELHDYLKQYNVKISEIHLGIGRRYHEN